MIRITETFDFKNKIICGDVLASLKKLPDGCIDCVVTSPPYWALRNYGLPDSVWGGVDGCEHEWVSFVQRPRGGKGKDSIVGANRNSEANNRDSNSVSSFCSKCNAWKGQLGLEPTFALYIEHLCVIFDEVKRVLKDSGTCFVNIGDTYYSLSGGKFQNDTINSSEKNLESGVSEANLLKGGNELVQKNLCNIPARFSIAMQDRGWVLRNRIVWFKRNCMPSSVSDRFTVDFEDVFFFVKNKKYYFERQLEPHIWAGKDKRSLLGRVEHKSGKTKGDDFQGGMNGVGYGSSGKNKRCVWDITTKGYSGAHFAVFPEKLAEVPIKAGCPVGGVVLDPFSGSGTTALVALKNQRSFVGIELNPDYVKLAMGRIKPFLEQKSLNVFDDNF